MAEPWLSADDIATHLGVTKDTVYTWIAEKAMPTQRVPHLWKFQASEIDDWVRAGAAVSDHEAPQQVTPKSVVAPTIMTTSTGRRDDDAE